MISLHVHVVGEYVDFDTVVLWDEMYSLCLAIILFINIIQLYQPMDFNVQLNAIKVFTARIKVTTNI